jgi:hypothetical protein
MPSSLMSPGTEQMVASRFEKVSVNSPLRPRTPGAPPPTPASAYPLETRRQTIAAETRSMLLSGVSQTQASSLGAIIDRRQSAPAEVILRQRQNSLLLFREQLQAWGHVHFGNATNADVFVAAVSMRRPSDSSSDGGEPDKKHSDRVTIRARVRPRDLDKKPFLITREFDLEELRSTIPQGRPTPTQSRRPSLDLTARAALPSSRRRATSTRTALRSSDRVLRSATNNSGGRQIVPGTKEIPIRKSPRGLTYSSPRIPILWAPLCLLYLQA